jgi:hypothetical protein
VARKPISIEIVEEDGSRFVIRTYAEGTEARAPVDSSKKATRRPRMRRHRLKSDRMDKTRRKRI